MRVLGLDIGGANLKGADNAGVARTQAFELWKDPAALGGALRDFIAQFTRAERLAVTMTGELCDCFASKRQGVNTILDAVAQAAGPTPIAVWCNDGRWRNLPEARRHPLVVAAANWLALAKFACRFAPSESALLIDIGSTTTDIVPLSQGQPMPRGRTDPERLAARELVYTGVRRTPVCALLGPEVAAELFATTLDVYLTLGWIAEDPADCSTADGRPATRLHAHSRLARMLCADAEACTAHQGEVLARRAFEKQAACLGDAVQAVISSGCVNDPPRASPATVILSGAGEFLARKVLDRMPIARAAKIVSLTESLGVATSHAACAYAVAMLLAEDDSREFHA